MFPMQAAEHLHALRPLLLSGDTADVKPRACCPGVLHSACICQVSADIGDKPDGGYMLRSTATTVKFLGYLAVYPPKTSAGPPPNPPLRYRLPCNYCHTPI